MPLSRERTYKICCNFFFLKSIVLWDFVILLFIMNSKIKAFAPGQQSASTESEWLHHREHAYELRIYAQTEIKAANSSRRGDKKYLI